MDELAVERLRALYPSASASSRSLARNQGPLVAVLALATRSGPFSAPGWLFELKYDGFRVLGAKDGSEVVLRYRSGRNATPVFPEVATAVKALPAPKHSSMASWSSSVLMAGPTSSCCARGR